jgi:hypothetical protein
MYLYSAETAVIVVHSEDIEIRAVLRYDGKLRNRDGLRRGHAGQLAPPALAIRGNRVDFPVDREDDAGDGDGISDSVGTGREQHLRQKEFFLLPVALSPE